MAAPMDGLCWPWVKIRTASLAVHIFSDPSIQLLRNAGLLRGGRDDMEDVLESAQQPADHEEQESRERPSMR